MLTRQSIFHEFLINQILSLEPNTDKKLHEFVDELIECLNAFEATFKNYKHSFGVNNVKCFITDKRAELTNLK